MWPTSPLPGYEQLQQRTRASPDVASWESEIAQRDAGVRVEKAKAVPDVTLIGGVCRYSQFNDAAYSIGINIPLPLFDRNRGSILEATRRRSPASRRRSSGGPVSGRESGSRSIRICSALTLGETAEALLSGGAVLVAARLSVRSANARCHAAAPKDAPMPTVTARTSWPSGHDAPRRLVDCNGRNHSEVTLRLCPVRAERSGFSAESKYERDDAQGERSIATDMGVTVH